MSTRWLLFLCFHFLSWPLFTWCCCCSLYFAQCPMSFTSCLTNCLFFLFFSFFPQVFTRCWPETRAVICSIHNMQQQYVRQQNLFFLPFVNTLQIFFLYLYMLYIIGERKLPFSHIFKEQESKLNYKSSENLSNLITHLHIKPTSEY